MEEACGLGRTQTAACNGPIAFVSMAGVVRSVSLAGPTYRSQTPRKRRAELAEIIARGEDPLNTCGGPQKRLETTRSRPSHGRPSRPSAQELKNERAIDNWIMPLRVQRLPENWQSPRGLRSLAP